MWLQVVIMAAIPIVGGLAPPWPKPTGVPMLLIGLGFVLVACALLVAGIIGLGRSFAVPPGPAPNATLVTTGIYARARHPVFGGWILVGFGFGLAFSPWALPLAVLLVLELLGKTTVEERHLSARYPCYADYRLAVRRRFFPRLLHR